LPEKRSFLTFAKRRHQNPVVRSNALKYKSGYLQEGQVTRSTRLSVVGLFLFISLFSGPVFAQWIEFTEETVSRLSGPAATLLNDVEEKDYAWGDIDKDGDIDLVVVRKQPFTSAGKKTNVLLLNESGVLTDFTAALAVSSSVPGDNGFMTATNDRDVKLVDVDGDTWLDVVTAVTISDGDPKHIGHPRIYINQGEDGGGNWLGIRYEDAWIPTLLSYTGQSGFNPRFCSIAVGDVSGDQRPDLWFGDYDSSGAGGNEQPPGADFNDRLLINNNGIEYIDETQARLSGLIEIPGGTDTAFEVTAFGAAAAIIDINGDGFNDIVKQTALNAPQYVGVAYNSPSNEGFFDNHEVVNQNAPYFVSVGDLNNDGMLDMVITDDGADRYLINLGNGGAGRAQFTDSTFQFQGTGDDGFGSNSIITDLDQDGWSDVLIADVDVDEAGCSRRLHIYHNQGGIPGDFPSLLEETGGSGCSNGSNPASCLIASIPADQLTGVHDVAIFDIDGNGWDDLVIGRCVGTQVWMNQGLFKITYDLPSPLPELINPGTPTAVQVEAVPSGDTIAPGSEKLFVSIDGGPYVESPLTALGNDIYEGTLPSSTCLQTMDFYFSASLSGGGLFKFPEDAPGTAFEAISAFGTQTVLAEGFEGDVSAWTVKNRLVLAGVWEQAVPGSTITGSGQQAAPGEDSEDNGVQAMVTRNSPAGGDAELFDLDGGPTDLISPSIDLTGLSAWISYDRWAFSEGGTQDWMEIAISDNGVDWQTVEIAGADQNQWTRTKFRVEDYVPADSTINMRFRIADFPNDSITEGGVDGFLVESFTCTQCVISADCNDGNFCNGTETCNAGICDPGTSPCPGQVCDEGTDSCQDCFVDADCDDGDFCNGPETCSANVCLPGTLPCPSSQCDDNLDSCVACTLDGDCDDGNFCNGAETCDGGTCSPPADACPGQTCDESGDTCVGNITLQPRNGDPVHGLLPDQLLRFEAGKTLFNTGLSAAQGLGPIFNQDSCASCHSNPIGGSGSIVVTRFGFDDPKAGGFDPLADLGGSLLQHSTISTPCAETIPAQANVTANRVTPTILGFGLVESIDDADIQAGETLPPPGVSGRAHIVEALEAPGVPRVGRFGWKAQVPTLLTFSGDASLNEMGLTNRLVPTENAPNGDLVLLASCDSVPDPEDGPDGEGFDFIDRVTDFQRFLAPPPQTPRNGMTGEAIFNSVSCASCHTPGFVTRDDMALEDALRAKVIRPYSDFLLHDMGQNADFIKQGDGGQREIRTPPLWGFRTRDPIWHDGRVAGGTHESRTRDAIALHDSLGSEGSTSTAAFNALSLSDQDALIAFLDSLGRVEFDHDGDNDVDLDDHVGFQGCFTGPGVFFTPDDPCSISDTDRDGDVDSDDEMLFNTTVSASAGDVVGLMVNPSGGMIQLDWTASCGANDDDYAIYAGTLGGLFDDHSSIQCSTGGLTSETVATAAGNVYYLVVPRNALREGSYGRDSQGAERQVGSGLCASQSVGVCQ